MQKGEIMKEPTSLSRHRIDTHCISVTPEIWSKFQSLAEENDRSISSYLRFLVSKEFKKTEGRKELVQVG